MKIRHHEFWNTHLFHFPIYLYWLYLSVRARSLFFFSAANPGIESGGMVGESKFQILQKIDSSYLPKTLYYKSVPTLQQILKELRGNNIAFPFIVKPDVGQGGWMIQRLHTTEELAEFLAKIKMAFMIQEYVTDPLELGIFYCRLPYQEKGYISSLVAKELLTVLGDGESSLRSLILNHPRVNKPLSYFKLGKAIDMDRIPIRNEKVVVSYLGNHSYGTRYINWNDKIDETITTQIDTLSKGIEGFYFGRFDIRCNSLNALREGNFKVLELNGAGAIPLHIFDPNESLRKAYISAFQHWKTMYQISQSNLSKGSVCMTFKEAWATCKRVLSMQKAHELGFTIGN